MQELVYYLHYQHSNLKTNPYLIFATIQIVHSRQGKV